LTVFARGCLSLRLPPPDTHKPVRRLWISSRRPIMILIPFLPSTGLTLTAKCFARSSVAPMFAPLFRAGMPPIKGIKNRFSVFWMHRYLVQLNGRVLSNLHLLSKYNSPGAPDQPSFSFFFSTKKVRQSCAAITCIPRHALPAVGFQHIFTCGRGHLQHDSSFHPFFPPSVDLTASFPPNVGKQFFRDAVSWWRKNFL